MFPARGSCALLGTWRQASYPARPLHEAGRAAGLASPSLTVDVEACAYFQPGCRPVTTTTTPAFCAQKTEHPHP